MSQSSDVAKSRKISKRHRYLLKVAQFIALLTVGIQVGVSYSHLMQWAGKLQLPLNIFVAVQNILIHYKFGLGVVECSSFLSLLTILWLSRAHPLIFRFTLGTLLFVVSAFLVWAVFIEPINVAISDWTSTSFPSNWEEYRNRWHIFHLVRLILLTMGMSSLIVASSNHS